MILLNSEYVKPNLALFTPMSPSF